MVQPLPSSDADLVLLARDGREDAFAELYSRYFPRVYDFLARLLKDRQEAADVTQDTFIRAMQTLPNLEKPESFRSWLFTIAHHNGLNLIQRSKRSVPTPTMEEPGRTNPLMRIVDEDRMSSPEQVVEAREVAEVVWEAAAGLDTRTYTVLDLHVRQGLKSAEIADVMGVSKGNAYTMVNRMKTSIRDSLGIYILARRGTKDCARLEALLAPFYLPPVTPEIRRMVERHAKTCDTCEENRTAFVLPLATFSALALVPPPAGTKAAIWAALGGGAALTGTAQSGKGSGSGAAVTGAAAASAALIAVAATTAPGGLAGTAMASAAATAGSAGGAASAAASAGSGAAFGMGKVAAALAIVVAIGAGAIGMVSLLSGDQPPPDVAVLSSTVVGDTGSPENVPVATSGSTAAPETTTTVAPTTTTTTTAAVVSGGTTTTTAPPVATPTPTPTTTTTAAPVTTTTASPVTTTTAPPVTVEVTAGADSVSTLEDVAVDVSVLANDDASLDAATLAIAAAPAHGSLTVTGGVITYAPDKDYFGPDSFQYTARNAAGLSATGTVTVAVTGVNDPPRVKAPITVTVDEDTSLTIDPMAEMFDVEGDAMSMVFFDPTSAAGGTVVAGSLIYTPPADFNGIDQFSYGISDGVDTTRVVVSVTVNAVNDAPTGTAPSVSTNVDTPLLIDVLGAYNDVDGDVLSFVFINPFETAAGGTFSLSDNQLLYVPPLGYVGTDQLDYMITDGTALVSASVSITVVGEVENTPPTVESQTVEVAEDAAVGTVIAKVTATDLEGDVLTFELSAAGPFGIDSSSGAVSLTGALNFEGVASYKTTVTVTDSAGGVGEAALTIVVLDVNEAPNIEDMQFLITATFKPGDSVGTLNASDPDVGDKLTYSVEGTDQFAITADGFVVVGEKFVPVEGDHEFIVTVADSGGLSASATVVIVVEPVTTVIGDVSFSPSAVYVVDRGRCDLGTTELTVTVEIVDPNFDARNVTVTWLNRLVRPSTHRMLLSEDGTWTAVVQFRASYVQVGEPAEMYVRAVSNKNEVAATAPFTVELLDCSAGDVIPARRSLQKAINLGRKGTVSRRKRTL